jgi:hypothetical protein
MKYVLVAGMTVPFVWVAGAEGLMLPKEGGIPLGKKESIIIIDSDCTDFIMKKANTMDEIQS